MNFIINSSNNNIGGIEVLFIEMAKYLASNNNKIFFLSNSENDIYKAYLKGVQSITFIDRMFVKPTEYCSIKELETEKRNIMGILDNEEEYIVISPYFDSLQFAMYIFGGFKKIKLVHIWAHPESWCNVITLKKRNSFNKKRIKNGKYYYQKRLLKYLKSCNADFYGAKVVPVFNSWYYEFDMDNGPIITFPIEKVDENSFTRLVDNQTMNFKIIWVGRFDYFKNQAIIHIHKVLENLAMRFPKTNIEFGIVGFGSDYFTNELKSQITAQKVKVNYHGKVQPNQLSEYFNKYNVGIGMGMTTKKMALFNLPTIVIDSFEDSEKYKNNASWIFKTADGDAGDGFYFNVAGASIENRSPLIKLLEEIVENPNLLNEYSEKSRKFVDENYDNDKQMMKILDFFARSSFQGKAYPIYRRNLLIRVLYAMYKWITSWRR